MVVYDDNTLRDAADHMVIERVGRLPVVGAARTARSIGIISRSDLLAAHRRRLAEGQYQVASTPAAVAARKKALFG